MTKADLEKLCREWQERLRLTDWQIELHHIPLLEEFGTCVSHLSKKQAHLRIRDQSYALEECSTVSASFDEEETMFFRDDEETTLVHELLHLLIKPFDQTQVDSLEYKAMEFACTALSNALVHLKRERDLNAT